MKTITIEQARSAVEEVYSATHAVYSSQEAYYTLIEFLDQQEHYIKTRNIMIPILLTKKE